MTGAELLRALQQIDAAPLMSYKVLIGVDGRWVELDSIKTDPSLKTVDLTGGKPGEDDEKYDF